MTAMTIGELVGYIRADNSDFERGLATSQLRMEGFRLDTNGRLRDLQGRFVDAGQVMERSLRGVGDEMGEVATQTVVYSSVVDRESRTMASRLRRVAAAARSMGESLSERLGRVRAGLASLNVDTDRLKGIGAKFGSIAMSVGGVAAKLGAAVPMAAGLGATLAQVAPAAGLAVSGLIAVQLATKALKLGMVGVSDAVSAALDPSDPEAYAEALKKLSPSARAFVGEIRTLQPQLKALQQGVQERLFQGLDGVLKGMGTHTLPILKNGLTNSAGALNLMGKNIGNTAIGMSKSGVLGRAISGANSGLYNMSRLPSQIMLGLTQVGAAAAPAFGRLTKAAGEGADKLSEKFSKAFEDGRVEAAIEMAIGLIKQIGVVAGNVFSIVGSVMGAASVSGGGFIGVLQQITGSLATAFSSPGVQAGLRAIFETMAEVGKVVAPLLATALRAIAPIFVALGPPIQRLVQALGAALGPIIKALGPVLESLAVAFGAIIDAVSPLLPVIGDLIAQLLPVLIPVFQAVAEQAKMMAPLLAQIGQVVMSLLTPVLAALTPVLGVIMGAFTKLTAALLPVVTRLITALAPTIAKLGEIFGELLVALAPLIEAFALLLGEGLELLIPVLIPIIDAIGKLASLLADGLSAVITQIVVPAINIIVALLKGDFSGAWRLAKDFVRNMLDEMTRLIRELPGRVAIALVRLAPVVWAGMQAAGNRMVESGRAKIAEVLREVNGLPAKAAAALGGVGSALWHAGTRLISGFIDGIRAMVPSLRGTLGWVTSMLPDWKGPPQTDAKILTPAGRSLIEGFQRGITAATPGLQAQLGGLTGALPGMVPGTVGSGGMASGGLGRLRIEVAGPQEFKALIRKIVAVDGRGSVQVAFG
ncbi:hypothetical protein [Streptomyces sp. NPDC051577]|uniref:phage tail protein n=1 Tax=Streptomyces sp. NPDC051577 TaxID=3155166 RepID=UPI00342B57FD